MDSRCDGDPGSSSEPQTESKKSPKQDYTEADADSEPLPRPKEIPNTASEETPSSRHRRARKRSRKNEEPKHSQPSRISCSLVAGAVLSVIVSCLLGWSLMQPPAASNIDIAILNTSLRESVVGQSPAITALISHLQRAQTADSRRVDFLALGPSGTGKTLLLQVLCDVAKVTAWRLLGDVDIGRDLPRLDKLSSEIASSAAAGSWLILAFDDVSAHIPQVVYLTEGVVEALGKKDVKLVTMVTVTTSDVAGEHGAEAEKLAFAHAHVLRFRPFRRSELAGCIRRFLRDKRAELDDVVVNDVVKAVKFNGQYAVSGCKPAIYQLQAMYDLASR